MATLAEELRRKLGAKNRAAFNALRREISEAFNEDYTNREVWELLREKGALKCSYRTFCRYVGEMGKSGLTPERKGAGLPHRNVGVVEVGQPVAPVRSGDNAPAIGGFKFERLDEKDLI